jgi:hypothetical protein
MIFLNIINNNTSFNKNNEIVAFNHYSNTVINADEDVDHHISLLFKIFIKIN